MFGNSGMAGSGIPSAISSNNVVAIGSYLVLRLSGACGYDRGMSVQAKSASVIVPAYREAPNIEALTVRLFAATRESGWDVDLIIVDDNSQDGTEAIVSRLSGQYDVKVIVRRNERGLSSAVLAGFAHARHENLAVMDADLQHPPEIIPSLLARLQDPDCDFVIATRYAKSGGVNSDWPLRRRVDRRVDGVRREIERDDDSLRG